VSRIVSSGVPGRGRRTVKDPTIYLATNGNAGYLSCLDAAHCPALLVSYALMESWPSRKAAVTYRKWCMDSGAFSVLYSGRTISLDNYIPFCRDMLAADPTLAEVFALDVIRDWRQGLVNVERMWAAGVPAIPVYHIGEPEDVLIGYARDYPKVGIGGLGWLKGKKQRLQYMDQVFARVWPCALHGLAVTDEESLFAVPWHCMTDDHEILTRRGWCGRLDVNKGDQVLAFEDGTARWEGVQEVYDYRVDHAEVVEMDNRAFSACVTRNHRWRVYNVARRLWEWTTTDRLISSDRIAKAPDRFEAPVEQQFEDWFVELCAWYWTEGSVHQHESRTSTIAISQSLSANPGNVDRIRQALQAGGVMFSETVSHRERPERVRRPMSDEVTFEFGGDARDRLLAWSEERSIQYPFLFALTRQQLELFVRTSIAGDGCATTRVEGGGFALTQKGGKNIEAFRVACLLAGYATSRYECQNGTVGTNSVERWALPKARSGDGPRIARRVVDYSGWLWCVRVRSGAFFTRCHGQIYVTGNSVDSSSWVAGPRYGTWRSFSTPGSPAKWSRMSARKVYDLRGEVRHYLRIEEQARLRWAREMAEVEARLRAAHWRGYEAVYPGESSGAGVAPVAGRS
jgi:hypothetical protein